MRRAHSRSAAVLVAAASLLGAACSSGDDDDAADTSATSSLAPAPTTTARSSTAPATTATPTTTAVTTATTLVPTTAAEPATVFPGRTWARQDAEQLGFDQRALDAIAAAAEAADSSCLLVVRHGRIAAEWNWGELTPATPREVFSVTKSITSTLVGIAEADGALATGQAAADFIPAWHGTDSGDVTVENLLSNDSGREWSVSLDYVDMVGSTDRSRFAVGLGQDTPPGESWAYNNAAIQTLSEVLQAATGTEPAAFADDRLFGAIGIRHTELTLDGAGNTNTFFGAQTTCRDLARFGLLFLNDGSWNGTEVVPAGFVEQATGAPSTDLAASYGYLWWLNRDGRQVDPTSLWTAERADVRSGQMVPGAPADMYWAQGLNDQIVQVDPGSDTVVVRLGASAPDGIEPFGSAATARVVTDALR